MEPNPPNPSTEARRFDLNMKEDLLEAWAPSDGIRELIANALDEQVLTGTDPVAIQSADSTAEIRDHGRGLRYEHFAQGEDEEKLSNPDRVIGKFGVGLKDALAVLYRHGVDVTIHSSHNTFTVEEAPKADFDDVETLHAVVHAPEHPDLQGTRVLLEGVSASDVETAKRNFLQFTNEERIEATSFGEIYAKPEGQDASIYVTGLRRGHLLGPPPRAAHRNQRRRHRSQRSAPHYLHPSRAEPGRAHAGQPARPQAPAQGKGV
jgi:hypothetical protein